MKERQFSKVGRIYVGVAIGLFAIFIIANLVSQLLFSVDLTVAIGAELYRGMIALNLVWVVIVIVHVFAKK